MHSPKRRFVFAIGIACWLMIVATGTALFWKYENASGVAAAAPNDWPSESRLSRASTKATLVLFAHPHCPCTRATIHELARLVPRMDAELRVFVVFIKPEGTEPGWERTGTWESSNDIPGVNVVRDDEGFEARIFDAHTSGQAMLYDRDGRLLFSGGLTAGRGLEGDSAGTAAIAAFVRGERVRTAETNVFGCPLFAHDNYCKKRREPANARSQR